jgi:hypothetical protein
MMGPVETAVRKAISAGDTLYTPSRVKPFTIGRMDTRTITLNLGALETATPIPWAVLEEVPKTFSTIEWTDIGMTFSTSSTCGTFDEFMKVRVPARATSNWVAALLEAAGVIEIDRKKPARIRILSVFRI